MVCLDMSFQDAVVDWDDWSHVQQEFEIRYFIEHGMNGFQVRETGSFQIIEYAGRITPLAYFV